jgi:pimeloyl-ACP methyl ester carboxylesterase
MIRVSRILAVVAALVSGAALVMAQPLRTGRTRSGIAFEVEGRGPIVVLITGSNLDRRMWAREAAWLRDSYTVVRYDLRAHGESDTATTAFSNVEDLLSLLDELDIQKATLVGLSAGSAIALDAALQSPARFDRLVLASPGISGYVPTASPPFIGALVAALQQHDYRQADEVLVHSSIFAVPAEQAALVRQMVMENNRLWLVPRDLIRRTGVNGYDNVSRQNFNPIHRTCHERDPSGQPRPAFDERLVQRGGRRRHHGVDCHGAWRRVIKDQHQLPEQPVTRSEIDDTSAAKQPTHTTCGLPCFIQLLARKAPRMAGGAADAIEECFTWKARKIPFGEAPT